MEKQARGAQLEVVQTRVGTSGHCLVQGNTPALIRSVSMCQITLSIVLPWTFTSSEASSLEILKSTAVPQVLRNIVRIVYLPDFLHLRDQSASLCNVGS